jgi:hypothetical protein
MAAGRGQTLWLSMLVEAMERFSEGGIMVAAWSVDRLGRSLQDLVGFLNELQALNWPCKDRPDIGRRYLCGAARPGCSSGLVAFSSGVVVSFSAEKHDF